MIRDLLRTPEAQSDPHYWASTFGGHCWIAVGPWAVIAMGWDMWTAAWLTPILYFICWEGLQFFLAPRWARTWALAWDCVLDTVAVAFGCYAAALLGNGHQVEAIWCWAASVIVIVVGWRVRS